MHDLKMYLSWNYATEYLKDMTFESVVSFLKKGATYARDAIWKSKKSKVNKTTITYSQYKDI